MLVLGVNILSLWPRHAAHSVPLALDVMMNDEIVKAFHPFQKKTQKGYCIHCIHRPLMITMPYSLLVHAFHESSGAMGQEFNNFLVNVCPSGRCHKHVISTTAGLSMWQGQIFITIININIIVIIIIIIIGIINIIKNNNNIVITLAQWHVCRAPCGFASWRMSLPCWSSMPNREQCWGTDRWLGHCTYHKNSQRLANQPHDALQVAVYCNSILSLSSSTSSRRTGRWTTAGSSIGSQNWHQYG